MKKFKMMVACALIGCVMTAATGCDDILDAVYSGGGYSSGYVTDLYYDNYVVSPLTDISLDGWQQSLDESYYIDNGW